MYLWSPPGAQGTFGPEVADLMSAAGRPLDAWQLKAVDAFASYGPGGAWHALECAALAPRQNGKSAGVLLPLVLADLFLWTDSPDRIIWTAHLFKTSREAFADFKRIIDGADFLRRRVKKIREANGEEGIELTSGAVLDFLARSKGGGRGLGGKRVVFDEALFLSAEAMGAILPTLAARPNVQVMYGSSAAKRESDQLRSLVARGRSGSDPSLAMLEFAAPGSWDAPGCSLAGCTHALGSAGCALDNPEFLAEANPAVAAGRIKLDFLMAMRRTLSPLEFGREFLGWHEQGDDATSGGLAGWESVGDPAGTWSSQFTLAFDVSIGSRSAAVSVAGKRDDDRIQLELLRSEPGVAWLPGFLAVVAGQHGGASRVVANDYPTCRALQPALEEAGVFVEYVGASDFAAACGWLQQAMADDQVRHLGDPVLGQAVASAAVANVGDGAWRWARKTSDSDISPIVAATLAGYALATAPAELDFDFV